VRGELRVKLSALAVLRKVSEEPTTKREVSCGLTPFKPDFSRYFFAKTHDWTSSAGLFTHIAKFLAGEPKDNNPPWQTVTRCVNQSEQTCPSHQEKEEK